MYCFYLIHYIMRVFSCPCMSYLLNDYTIGFSLVSSLTGSECVSANVLEPLDSWEDSAGSAVASDDDVASAGLDSDELSSEVSFKSAWSVVWDASPLVVVVESIDDESSLG